MTSETTTADQTTLLCDASPDQMARFEAAARAAGHASGKSAANDWNLWGNAAADAIAFVSDIDTDAPRLMDYYSGEDIRAATDDETQASRQAIGGVILLAKNGTILAADDTGADDARHVYVAE